MFRAQQAFADDEGLLEQRDRVGWAARRLVGGGQAVPRVSVSGCRGQQPVKVRGQRLADRDGLGRAVAELDQVIERQEPSLSRILARSGSAWLAGLAAPASAVTCTGTSLTASRSDDPASDRARDSSSDAAPGRPPPAAARTIRPGRSEPPCHRR